MRKTLPAAVLALLVAACAQQPAPSPAAAPPPPPPAPPAAAAPAAPPSDAQVAPRTWDVDRVRCSDLLAAADEDRASAAMFYYGYLAAKSKIHIIDVNKISDNIAKVMTQCTATPSITVPEAFRRALRPRK
jgi:HdeA/HdeB family protein